MTTTRGRSRSASRSRSRSRSRSLSSSRSSSEEGYLPEPEYREAAFDAMSPTEQAAFIAEQRRWNRKNTLRLERRKAKNIRMGHSLLRRQRETMRREIAQMMPVEASPALTNRKRARSYSRSVTPPPYRRVSRSRSPPPQVARPPLRWSGNPPLHYPQPPPRYLEYENGVTWLRQGELPTYPERRPVKRHRNRGNRGNRRQEPPPPQRAASPPPQRNNANNNRTQVINEGERIQISVPVKRALFPIEKEPAESRRVVTTNPPSQTEPAPEKKTDKPYMHDSDYPHYSSSENEGDK
jgi:hypothetical protein